MGHDATALLMQTGRDFARLFGHGPSALCRVDDEGWLGFNGEQGSADLNMCFVARTATRSIIEGYVRTINERGLAALVIVDEGAPELVEAAVELGLTAVGEVPVMLWENGPRLTPSDSYDVRLATEDDYNAVIALLAEALPLDEDMCRRAFPSKVLSSGVEVWVADQDGGLVGTATLIRTDDHVGVYMMATPPRLQRQGVGRAVLQTAMAHHLARGATTFTLEATEAGFHLYEQVGYGTVASPTVLVAGDSAQFPG